MDTTDSKLTTPTQSSQLITIDKAKELHVNYNKKGLRLTAAGTEDANAVWYSLEDLENYINFIKSEGIQKGYTVDGIRFYFGIYPASENNGRAGLTTIFLAPTGLPVSDTAGSLTVSPDITVIKPLNYGSMGNPPKMNFGG